MQQILLVGENEKLANLIKNNVKSAIVEPLTVLDPIRVLINKPDFYDLIIISNSYNKNDKISLINKIQACSDLQFLTIITEVLDVNDQEISVYIQAGARFCLPSNDVDFALTVLKKALADSRKLKIKAAEINIAKNINSALFKYQNLSEAKSLSDFIAQACPNPKAALLGITELLINAIEHGNLAINYDDKSASFDEDWSEMVANRLKLPENKNKFVTVEFVKNAKEISIKVTDEGEGFDWKKFQKIDKDRMLDTHGRGIFMATNLSFSSLQYMGKGNVVVATIKL